MGTAWPHGGFRSGHGLSGPGIGRAAPTASRCRCGRRTAAAARSGRFSGLRPYAAGDSPRQISWRHAARTGQLLTRETDAPLGVVRHLAWTDTAGETEARLSRLAAWIETLRTEGTPFSLELPGVHLPSGSGEAHVRAAQTALARHTPLPQPPEVARSSLKPARPDGVALRATLLALGVALLPLVLRVPVWASVLTFALLTYAAVRTRRALPPAPAWLLGLLAGLGAWRSTLSTAPCWGGTAAQPSWRCWWP
ncbi:DUF58 domain-containing protein [Deinococcus malanensis]|uniref:DUF58 domain-containing protein n=1 Tax=Deinococcus malanensis TaxID=1706855 RepID=UPI00363521E2